MRFLLRRAGELIDLRGTLRAELVKRMVPDDAIDDIVLAVNEVVAAALVACPPPVGSAIDVRLTSRMGVSPTVSVQIRLTGDQPLDLGADEIRAAVLQASATGVRSETLLGGDTIEIRRTFEPALPAI